MDIQTWERLDPRVKHAFKECRVRGLLHIGAQRAGHRKGLGGNFMSVLFVRGGHHVAAAGLERTCGVVGLGRAGLHYCVAWRGVRLLAPHQQAPLALLLRRRPSCLFTSLMVDLWAFSKYGNMGQALLWRG